MLTFKEFCSFAKIGLSTFSTLRAQGLAPEILYVSARCPRITKKSAEAWIAQRQSTAA